jgi:hypothetical protein
MSAANTTRWIGIGLLGLPLYGALTFFSSLNPQPDPSTQYEAWSRFVTTNGYVLKHLFASVLGIHPRQALSGGRRRYLHRQLQGDQRLHHVHG